MEEKLLSSSLNFLKEIEKFKTVKRKIHSSDGSSENSAEHSWHLAMFVMVFKEEFSSYCDYSKLLELALIHDLVEVYAGDAFPFSDNFSKEDKHKKELDASNKLYSILPRPKQDRFFDLFNEYESLLSREAIVIKALDKVQPDLINLITNGSNWSLHNIDYDKLMNYKLEHINKDELSKEIFDYIINFGLEKGWLIKK